jgi:hypothetical protein
MEAFPHSGEDGLFKRNNRTIEESKTMELGVRSVLKKFSESTGTSISSIVEGQETEDKGTWDDIKSRI